MVCCPTCGQSLPGDRGFVFDEEAGIVVANGRFAHLRPQQASIFAMLLAASPRGCTKEQLHDGLYLHEQDAAEIKIIDVHVCMLRKKLKPLGIEIMSFFKGYRLKPLAEREAA